MLDLLFCYLLPIAISLVTAYIALTGNSLRASCLLVLNALVTLVYLTCTVLSSKNSSTFHDQSLPFVTQLAVATAAFLSLWRFGTIFFWIAWLGTLAWPASMLYLYLYLSSRFQHW